MTPLPHYQDADDLGDALRPSQEQQPHERSAQRAQQPKGEKKAAMARATSMLEMSDVHDMRRFGEDVSALSGARDAADDEDVGFSLDASDGSSEDSAMGGGFLKTMSVANANEEADRTVSSGALARLPPTTSGSARGMRRVVSMASLSSASRSGKLLSKFGLSAIAPDIHTISEAEEDILDDASLHETTETGLDASINSRRSRGMLGRSRSSANVKDGRTPEVGLDASVTSRKPFMKRSASTASMNSRTPEVGLDESVTSRKPFRRIPSSASMSSRTPEVGLDESVTSRKPFRRISSSASMNSRTPEVGLDESVTSRKPIRRIPSSVRIGSRTPEEGLDESITSRKPSVKRSASSASEAGPDESVSGRKPFMKKLTSGLKLRNASSNSLRGLGRGGGLRSSGTSVPSMDSTNHSIRSVDSTSHLGDTGHSLRSSIKSDDSLHDPAANEPVRRAQLVRSPSKSSLKRSPSTNSMKRNVSFSSLEIRHHPMTLGDAPASAGPPVALSWEHDPDATEEHSVDAYELNKADVPRRVREELRMPPAHRQYLLMREAGFARGEIRASMVEARRVARNRHRTNLGNELGLQPVEEAWEAVRRRMAFRKRKKESGNALP